MERRARKWSGFTCKRASEDTTLVYRARSTEERRILKKKAKSRGLSIFLFARRVRKIALYSDLIHTFDWKSAVEHDGGV